MKTLSFNSQSLSRLATFVKCTKLIFSLILFGFVSRDFHLSEIFVGRYTKNKNKCCISLTVIYIWANISTIKLVRITINASDLL